MAPGRVAMARVAMGRAPTGRAAMARRASGVVDHVVVRVPAARAMDPGVMGRARSTVRGATGPGATGRLRMARGRSSPVPPVRAAPTIAGAPPDRGPTAAGRVGRVGGARVPGRTVAALDPTVEVRGPDRAIDSDRVRGRGLGRIAAPTSAMTGHATNRGALTIGHPRPAASM